MIAPNNRKGIRAAHIGGVIESRPFSFPPKLFPFPADKPLDILLVLWRSRLTALKKPVGGNATRQIGLYFCPVSGYYNIAIFAGRA
jgi:hypothetical protein